MPKFEREVEIDAPVERVWEVLTDPKHWPEWFPGVDAVANVPAISPGASVQWTSELGTGTAMVVAMEPMKRLEVVTQMGDDKDSHVFELRASGGFFGLNADECKVNYTLDTLMGGGLLGKFVAGGNPKDAMRVKRAMVLFRKVVESL